jgi:hypothetical protein
MEILHVMYLCNASYVMNAWFEQHDDKTEKQNLIAVKHNNNTKFI